MQWTFISGRIYAACRGRASRTDQMARNRPSQRSGGARGGAAGAAAHMSGSIFPSSGRPVRRSRPLKGVLGCPSLEASGATAYGPRAPLLSPDPRVVIMRLSGGGEVRGARRRPAGRRTQSVVMGYDPHALESDAESPALARGRLGQNSGDLVGSSRPCVSRELVLGGEQEFLLE